MNAATTTYSQFVWQQGLDAFLREHAVSNPEQPFFIFNAMQTVHSPMQAPAGPEEHPACALIPNEDRKIYCAMLVTTDSLIQNTFAVMEDNSFADNTFVVFSADNGGSPGSGGYNMPLRGNKGTFYEGGVRAAAFVWDAPKRSPRYHLCRVGARYGLVPYVHGLGNGWRVGSKVREPAKQSGRCKHVGCLDDRGRSVAPDDRDPRQHGWRRNP